MSDHYHALLDRIYSLAWDAVCKGELGRMRYWLNHHERLRAMLDRLPYSPDGC